MLAGTYDPQVLGSQDMRSVTPDPAAARLWYQKAAQLGSADAKRRLSQSQTRHTITHHYYASLNTGHYAGVHMRRLLAMALIAIMMSYGLDGQG